MWLYYILLSLLCNFARAQKPGMIQQCTRKLHYLLSKEFIDDGIKVGKDKLFDLLREEGLLIKKKRRYTKTTDSKHWIRRYPNLIKDMTIERPEQVWVADITYVPVGTGFICI